MQALGTMRDFRSWPLGATTCACAALLSGQGVLADAQSDALAQAQRTCHDITLSPAKRSRALTGWTPANADREIQTQLAISFTLLYGEVGTVPYPTAEASIRALLPDLAEGIDYEASDLQWAFSDGSITYLTHDTGWHATIETYPGDDSFSTCTLWHTDLSDDSRALIASMTGVFSGYTRPFQTITEINAWMTRGTYDHDLYLAVSYPRQDLYPDFADVYLTFETYSYDITEEY